MAKANVANEPIECFDPNPHRIIESYPIDERKIEKLIQSYVKNGMWEGVIARRKDNRVQIAFGHHRLEAAKRHGIEKIPVILRDLTDEEMLQFMAWENLEEFNSNFFILLETWEAGVKFRAETPDAPEKIKQVDVAKLLGWIETDGKTANKAAKACSGALELITEGHLDRDDFMDNGVTSALEIVRAVRLKLKEAQTFPEEGGEREKRTKRAGEAGKQASGRVREGTLPESEAGAAVKQAATPQRGSKKIPEFYQWSERLIARLSAVLNGDAQERDLLRLIEALPYLTEEEEIQQINAVRMELGMLIDRAEELRKQFPFLPQKKPRSRRVSYGL